MTLEEYVWMLESQVDPELVRQIQDWSDDTKLYMYLHNIQLDHMAEFKHLLMEMKNERRI
jgi:hypothetical protein